MTPQIVFQVGQTVVDKDCKSKCVCQASGLVKCEKLSCTSGDVCDVRDGVRGCHIKQGQCTISQVGKLSSFDDLSGAIGTQGAFEVASLCDEAAKQWFRVVVDVRKCIKGASPAVATVYVFFKDAIVTVNRQHEAWVRSFEHELFDAEPNFVLIHLNYFCFCFYPPVFHVLQVNGRKVTLPSKVTNELSVQVSDRSVVIEKTSGVRVTYSVSQEVTVTVDSSMSGKMCGACGNYNNNSKDDLKTADGKIATDMSAVVSSWSAGDFSRW